MSAFPCCPIPGSQTDPISPHQSSIHPSTHQPHIRSSIIHPSLFNHLLSPSIHLPFIHLPLPSIGCLSTHPLSLHLPFTYLLHLAIHIPFHSSSVCPSIYHAFIHLLPVHHPSLHPLTHELSLHPHIYHLPATTKPLIRSPLSKPLPRSSPGP